MPRFCKCGSDMFICQECGSDKCSGGCNKTTDNIIPNDEWIEGKGNVCDRCLSIRYFQNRDKTWEKVRTTPHISLKGNPAYDLMM